ncbi:MAG: type 1 glutamine amidotransferase [Microthrixaceae bacterium]
MRALHVHHDPNSLPGLVGAALAAQGVEEVVHRVCVTPGSPVGDPVFPEPDAFDLVVLYGSRWSFDDPAVAHWVDPEQEFLRAADAAGVPVLGLCFGGQVLAAALGGSVGRAAHPEVGWCAVEPADPGTAAGRAALEAGVVAGPWLQWHGDAFTPPPGALELARTGAGAQAFRLGGHLGLQFHPEADREVLEAWLIDDDLDQLEAAGVDPDVFLADCDRHRAGAEARARALVERVLSRVA